jgi:cell pole-organizing protein PopZ
MDEILASIRKIIENNEAQPDLAADADGDEGFDISMERETSTEREDNLLDHPSVVERFHVEEHRSAAQPMPRAEPVQAAQPALSLADVAARVRAASERHVAAAREPAISEPANREPANREPMEREQRQVEPVQAASRGESPLVTARMAANAGRSTSSIAEEMPLPEVAEQAADTYGRAVAREDFKPAQAAMSERVQTEDLATGNRDVATLVSPAVSERVAQSFGALAQAFDAGPRRSFDEIAEDMLRPMLQEWLDDNLPTLVERLVREEIERVARGPRR